jgi:polyphosphate kinase
MHAQYIQRDISWLTFNHRVLQEAQDMTVPLLERIKFLAIYSSNLNEFYRVRVSSLRNLAAAGKKTRKELDFDPEKVFLEVRNMIAQQQLEFGRIFDREIVPELRKNNIYLLRRLELDGAQRAFIENYFHTKMSPFVQPVVVVKQKIRPFLNNAALYLAVTLTEKTHEKQSEKVSDKQNDFGGTKEQRNEKEREKDKKNKQKQIYAIVKIPSDYLSRFLVLPTKNDGQHCVIMLDDVVRHCLPIIFPGYDIHNSYSIKLTRDAELYIDNEYSGDIIEKISTSLAKRNVGPAARFAYDREMPEKILLYLTECFGIEISDCFPAGRYLNNFDFFGFPDFGLSQLKDEELKPLSHKVLEAAPNMFDAIAQQDHLLHFPYQSYDYVIRFFEEAADDPNVQTIRLTQYRVSDRSRIMEALIRASKNGKEVMVFVEVKARFDEESNLRWANTLKDAGAKVLFSHPGIKVHAKIAVVTRREGDALKDYCYLSTGNFNEKTAKTYVDFGYLTANEQIAQDAQQLFMYLQIRRRDSVQFKSLLIGQFNLFPTITELINNEIAIAKRGEDAYILLKLNSIEDLDIISLLYDASKAGVKIDLIVRGICCIRTGIKGLSENIKVYSIIDRFLEHHRIYYFGKGERARIYLASADWMTRNLHRRIETAFPIIEPAVRIIIDELLKIQLSDNLKTRYLEPDLQNRYKNTNAHEPIRAQVATYNYLKEV